MQRGKHKHITWMVSVIIAQALIGSGGAVAQSVSALRYAAEAITFPSGADFGETFHISNSGQISGNSYKCGEVTCVPSVFVYHHGSARPVADGFALSANDSGIIGGMLVTDLDNFFGQAALFREGQPPMLIPRLPDEISSVVIKVTVSGTALVWSLNSNFDQKMYFYKNGFVKFIQLPLDATISAVNGHGIIAGTIKPIGKAHRAFRFDPWNNSLTILDPLPTESNSWGLDLNNAGEVLGYSFNFSRVERIGYWRGRTFHTSFVQGTPELPTLSNSLVWNESGLIAITRTTNPDRTRGDSYVVPSPGVRLKLSDITRPSTVVAQVADMNDNGDMITDFGMVLKREPQILPAVAAAAMNAGPATAEIVFAKPCPKKLAEMLAKRPPIALKPTSLTKWCGFSL